MCVSAKCEDGICKTRNSTKFGKHASIVLLYNFQYNAAVIIYDRIVFVKLGTELFLFIFVLFNRQHMTLYTSHCHIFASIFEKSKT